MTPGHLLDFGPTFWGPPAMPADFPERLHLLKDLSGLSWAAMANRLGTDERRLARWRGGTTPGGWAVLALLHLARHIPSGLYLLTNPDPAVIRAVHSTATPLADPSNIPNAPSPAIIAHDFPPRLALLKSTAGLTWGALGTKLGVEQRQIRNWRSGTAPAGAAMFSILELALAFPDGVDILTITIHEEEDRALASYPSPRDNFTSQFPSRLDQFKCASGLSWKGLARQLETDIRTVSRWRNGKAPAAEHYHDLLVLANALKLVEVLLPQAHIDRPVTATAA